MTLATSRTQTQVSVRPYAAGDEPAVLALAAADWLLGQPAVTAVMLHEALAGRSEVDAGWWEELDRPVTDVACDRSGAVVGVVSYATRPGDGAGFLLWLHCREELAVARVLVDHVLTQLGPSRTVCAFEFASALTLGLEGLPARHRPVTRQVLTDAGFADRDLWRYMHRLLPAPGLPRASNVTAGACEGLPGRRLEVHDGADTVAEATIGQPAGDVGVLWWISVTPAARGRGLGLALLGSALEMLVDGGAGEVVLFVDDDAPPDDSERDRTAANRMYDRAGFVEVDRLHSFTRRP